MLDDLAEAVEAAERILPSLRPLLAEPRPALPRAGSRPAPDSSEPWNSEAAAVYWDIWYGSRGLARQMRAELQLADDCLPGPEGLAQIRACGATISRRTLGVVTARIWSWVARANALPDMGEAEPWRHLPTLPGFEPPACPYCRTFGLRMQAGAGHVRCFYPDCRDLDDHPTRAKMQLGTYGTPALFFADGTVLSFPPVQG
jgi:hypothetical protein